MIELSTTWQQTTQVLEQEDFDGAYWVLEGAFGAAGRVERARLSLLVAGLHSLYGDAGIEDTRGALLQSVTLDPDLKFEALYQALNAELTARQDPAEGARLAHGALQARTTLSVPGASALARYHAMVALALAEQPQGALDTAPPSAELPVHLRWRLRSWQADSEEQLGHHDDAANLYAEAAHLATGLNRAIMLQERAAVLLQLDRFEEALESLERAHLEYQGGEGEALHLASWHYLRAQALLGLERPQEALISVQEAGRLELEHGDPSYGVQLVWGQVMTALGESEQATEHFQKALELSQGPDRAYALHELGVAYLDCDLPLEARERLREALGQEEYPFVPEVYADLAEAEYRLGRLQEAEASAQQALAQGATVPASLVLGSVALDYYHLDEALEHYRRVVGEAAPGSRDWITGHQMAADILAQQGFRDPGAIYAHASQALAHTEHNDEWYTTLSELITRAENELRGGGQRTLN